jgi:hypothetical protein
MNSFGRNLIAAVGVFLMTHVADSAFANQLVNGGFEVPVLPADSYLNIGPGGEPFGWQVTAGDIDIVRLPLPSLSTYFNAFEGSQVLDLNGFTRGTISQDFPTLAGQVYLTTFAYADNPRESGLSTASISVTDVGTTASLLNDSVAHSSSSDSIANYVTYSKSFTAVGALSRLTIASTSPSGDPSGGIFLDAVAVTSVREKRPRSSSSE